MMYTEEFSAHMSRVSLVKNLTAGWNAGVPFLIEMLKASGEYWKLFSWHKEA
jgi:hypothetical protein